MSKRRFELSDALLRRVATSLASIDRSHFLYRDVVAALESERAQHAFDAIPKLVHWCSSNDECDPSQPGRFPWLAVAIGSACAREAADLRKLIHDLSFSQRMVMEAAKDRWPGGRDD